MSGRAGSRGAPEVKSAEEIHHDRSDRASLLSGMMMSRSSLFALEEAMKVA